MALAPTGLPQAWIKPITQVVPTATPTSTVRLWLARYRGAHRQGVEHQTYDYVELSIASLVLVGGVAYWHLPMIVVSNEEIARVGREDFFFPKVHDAACCLTKRPGDLQFCWGFDGRAARTVGLRKLVRTSELTQEELVRRLNQHYAGQPVLVDALSSLASRTLQVQCGGQRRAVLQTELVDKINLYTGRFERIGVGGTYLEGLPSTGWISHYNFRMTMVALPPTEPL
ncbi:MAG: hypothetical protein H6730_22670 [Deltaproteobacteria bacterium]|nr:hypothetical protein [Deltaproteobacteria bacterium]